MIFCDKTNEKYTQVIRDAILREHNIMLKLKHPNIPAVIEIIEDEESIFIVREYIEGVNISTLLNNHGAQSADTVIAWGKELCSVLGYLHKATPYYVYLDMKPLNVLLTTEGTLKVINFGSVCINGEWNGNNSYYPTNIGYAAPEQFGGLGQLDERTDIFGLGMTMHHLATGVDPSKPPYETKPICQINPTLPKGLEYIISKCTEINPDNRYQSCDELMADLNNYMNLPKPNGFFSKLFRKG